MRVVPTCKQDQSFLFSFEIVVEREQYLSEKTYQHHNHHYFRKPGSLDVESQHLCSNVLWYSQCDTAANNRISLKVPTVFVIQ